MLPIKKTPSSIVESNCVTFTASRSILPCRELERAAMAVDSRKRLLKRSSACFDREESCRIILVSVPFVTHSSSFGTSTASTPWSSRGRVLRQTCTGSMTLWRNGITHNRSTLGYRIIRDNARTKYYLMYYFSSSDLF